MIANQKSHREKRETKNYKGPDYDEGEDVKVDVATLRVVDTGYDGVEETPTGKWTAFIGGRGTAGPKTVFKEEYDTIKQAVTARNTAALYLGRHWYGDGGVCQQSTMCCSHIIPSTQPGTSSGLAASYQSTISTTPIPLKNS